MQPRPEHPITIIGAGPAGLMLGCLLQTAGGFACTILEHRGRAHIQARARAGLLEAHSVALLDRAGLADRLRRDGTEHHRCELRVGDSVHVIEFAELAGATQWVWPQQELVTDLVEAFLHRGGKIVFDAEQVSVSEVDTPEPVVRFRHDGHHHELRPAVVAGADGFHGVSRSAIPAAAARSQHHEHPFGWVAVLAAAPPTVEHIVYARHARGFAGHMLRSPRVTRFYLQCPRTDTIEAWPDERIWEELRLRLASPAVPDWQLREGPVIAKSVLPMRSVVTEPMQHGRLYLLGDAAHIVTPVGAKGANLALGDAEVLAEALCAWAANGDESLLQSYSARCLTRVWRAQAFSHHLTHLIHQPDPTLPGAEFQGRLTRAALETMLGSPADLRSFADAYVGVDPRTAP